MRDERTTGERFARPLFLLTVLTGSFLLFLTQPMIARMALPRLGGAPAVWNSAMLVYQGLLLAGYAYAHFLTRLRPRRQAGLHLALFAVAALWLPIGVSSAMLPADARPGLVGALVPGQLDRAALLHRLRPGAADAALVRAGERAAATPIRSTPPPTSAASPACSPIPCWSSRC